MERSAAYILRWVAPVSLLAVLVTGCALYEDTHTGTYRQTDPTDEFAPVEVDFFRFGDHATATIRFYEQDPATNSPFGEQTFCAQAHASSFEKDDQSFNLELELLPRFSLGPETQLQLIGKITSHKKMRATLFKSIGETAQPVRVKDGKLAEVVEEKAKINLERTSPSAEAKCDSSAGGRQLRYQFPSDLVPQKIDGVPYSIKHPVAGLWWIAKMQTTVGGTEVPRDVHHIETITDFVSSSHTVYNESEQTFEGTFARAALPPPQNLLMRSGNTRYGLAHFTVLDYAGSSEAGIDLKKARREKKLKLLGQSIRAGTRPSPECPDGTAMWGPVLLFVQGSIFDLGNRIRERIPQLSELESSGAEINRHFFVADACVNERHQIERLNIDKRPRSRPIPLFLTHKYLDRAPKGWPLAQIE